MVIISAVFHLAGPLGCFRNSYVQGMGTFPGDIHQHTTLLGMLLWKYPVRNTPSVHRCALTAIDMTVREYCGSLQGLYQHPRTPMYNYICTHAASLVSLAVCPLDTKKHTRGCLHSILSSLLVCF